jgi:hypothetical protein
MLEASRRLGIKNIWLHKGLPRPSLAQYGWVLDR